MWEDSIGGFVPTNSASGGAIAGLPPDEPPMYRKKKKKKFDGRNKDVREFVSKLLQRREKRTKRKEKKLRELGEQINNNIAKDLTILQESGGKVIDQLKKIAMAGGTGTVQFDDGSKQPVEPSEAGKIVNLYQNLNASNRVKMIKSINSSTNAYEKVKAFAQSRT